MFSRLLALYAKSFVRAPTIGDSPKTKPQVKSLETKADLLFYPMLALKQSKRHPSCRKVLDKLLGSSGSLVQLTDSVEYGLTDIQAGESMGPQCS